MKAFECKGCSVVIFIKKKEKEPLWCPMCRTSMVEVKVEVERRKFKRYKCPECKYEFFMEKNSIPYKCPNCNYTFITTEGKLYKERL